MSKTKVAPIKEEPIPQFSQLQLCGVKQLDQLITYIANGMGYQL